MTIHRTMDEKRRSELQQRLNQLEDERNGLQQRLNDTMIEIEAIRRMLSVYYVKEWKEA